MKNKEIQNRQNQIGVKRISMSLKQNLFKEFEKSMVKAGFSDRSKAIQAALYAFVDENKWKAEDSQSGAGAVVMLYDNHVYNQDRENMHVQHQYSDIIGAATHLHLDESNCLETIMVRGRIKRIRELVNVLSRNRGIKSIKLHFVSLT